MSIHVLGIRHHGPGSARRVMEELSSLKPDLILLEGPAEADDLVQYVKKAQMRPPVALLAYQTDEPQNAVFYPFAYFSPEWQAMKYAKENKVPLRFFDLPIAHKIALNAQEKEQELAKLEQELDKSAQQEEQSAEEKQNQEAVTQEIKEKAQDSEQEASLQEPSKEQLAFGQDVDGLVYDPMSYYAQIEGMEDGEQWWDSMFERRLNNEGAFEAIIKAMAALREELPQANRERDLVREAWMRKCIREAVKAGYQKIAICCGAFHAPVLVDYEKYKVKDDNALIKGLPKVKVGITWIPWTYSRLSYRSGYGAGIDSPGFYEHVMKYPNDDGSLWLTKVANALRNAKFDISSAHVIESVRLAQTLAALRNLPHPSLREYNEAVTTVMNFGDETRLKVVNEQVIVGNKIGRVPSDAPKVPLVADLERLQKQYRLPFNNEPKQYILDLRKELDLSRSTLLHRLLLLDVQWGKTTYSSSKGTFKETWDLYYKPEMLISLIEKAVWGNTVESAVFNYVVHNMNESTKIADLTKLLNKVIPCNMPKLCDALSQRIDDLAATGSDVVDLMHAVVPLCEIVRYGTVRKIDFSAIADMLKNMLERILAGGLLACINIADDAAEELLEVFNLVTDALRNLNDEENLQLWLRLMEQVHSTSKVHPLLCGGATRVLRQLKGLDNDAIIDSMSFYTSQNNKPMDMAFYLEGFLQNSGTLITLDNTLWTIVYRFITLLDEDNFKELLPILRRTFSDFAPQERAQIGQKAKQTAQGANGASALSSTSRLGAKVQGGLNNNVLGLFANTAGAGANEQGLQLYDEQGQKVVALFKQWFDLNES